jgi:hypothetical protein
MLFGHVVSKHKMMVDPKKVKLIKELDPRTNPSKVKIILGIYKLLSKTYKGSCKQNNPNGEDVKGRDDTQMDNRMPVMI